MEEKVILVAPLHEMAQPPNPGPIDKSVLVEQEDHKSEAIFTGRGYKPVRFIEHGTRLNQWEVKHEGMLALLRRAGFYYLSCLKRVQLDHALLNALVERWRRETQTFHLRYGEITILLKDVAILSGLRVDGTPVTGPADCRWDELCLELLGQQPAKVKGGAVSIAWLYETFHKIPDGADKQQIEYATRAYILYQLGCSLFPDPSGTRVHLRYLPLLRDFDLCGEMAWGAAALSHLYRELGKASMKGKTNCCAFLTLLQIWAWEHIHIGRPERLEVKAPLHDRPLGCRWNVPFKSRENVRSIDTEFYRHGLDTILDSQITWDPYNPYLMAVLPPFCTAGSAVWLSRVPLICFQVVEMHVPDRVLLQFGMIQHIPDPVEVVERVTMQGRSVEDWSTYHSKYIRRWADRLSTVVRQSETVDPDPTRARNHYFEWYWNITRRWISTPVERPTISFQSLGQSERALVDLVTTVQRRIRRLLSGEVERKRLKEDLAEIDAYISTELEKAKQPSTPEVRQSRSRQKQKIRSSSPRYLRPPAAIPLAIEAGIATRFIESVQHSPVMQALPIKADPDSEDNNHQEEGNTILELDQMRSIEPVGIQLQEEAADSSSKEAEEENGKVQENVNEPTEKTVVRETANEKIENDERMETTAAAIEGDKVQDNPDIAMKDEEVRKSISTNMESAKELETVDEPVKADAVQETLAVTIKDGKLRTLDSPMRSGEVKEGVDESIGDGRMDGTVNALVENDEIYKVAGESIEDGNVHDTIHASTKEDEVQEIHHDELVNDEKSETIEAHMEHVEEQERADEPLESSQVREEQGRVDEPMEISIVPEEHEWITKPVETSNIADDAKAPTENANISEEVGVPMENDEIQEAHDGLMKDDEAHKTVEARMCVEEEQEKGDEPMESSRVQDNVEAPARNAKIEGKVGASAKNRATPHEVMEDDEVQETLEVHLMEYLKEQERVNETLEDSKLLANVEAPMENASIKEKVTATTKNEEVRENPDGVLKDDEVRENVGAHIKHSKSEEIGNGPKDNSKVNETLDFPMKRDKIKGIVTEPTKEVAVACVGWSEVPKRLRSNRRKRKRFHVQSTF